MIPLGINRVIMVIFKPLGYLAGILSDTMSLVIIFSAAPAKTLHGSSHKIRFFDDAARRGRVFFDSTATYVLKCYVDADIVGIRFLTGHHLAVEPDIYCGTEGVRT